MSNVNSEFVGVENRFLPVVRRPFSEVLGATAFSYPFVGWRLVSIAKHSTEVTKKTRDLSSLRDGSNYF